MKQAINMLDDVILLAGQAKADLVGADGGGALERSAGRLNARRKICDLTRLAMRAKFEVDNETVAQPSSSSFGTAAAAKRPST